ncbi:MinD/ParA family protein [Clostridium sp. BJN0001]|uniref:MinD/ParA family protein n=1 Tax=Clostridium sp. BJN0001 TaxID=2930219 RepID=UPI001FD47953|nr:MinD/ParA family protein [Clostridium sp. BJN0001]
MIDQAESLRKLAKEDKKRAKVITVTSGKGGVGKSNFVVNLAISLQKKGKNVLIFDADLGMGNDDVLMGLYPQYNIFDAIFTNMDIKDIIIEGPEGINLVPAGSGLNKAMQLKPEQRDEFLKKLDVLDDYDYILMDTGAGVNKDVLEFIKASEKLIVITTPEPTSITDAYSLIKATDYFKLKTSADIIVNKSFSYKEALDTFSKLNRTIERFLNIKVNYLGAISDDKKLVMSVRAQRPFIMSYPQCEASKDIDNISNKILGLQSENTQGARGVFRKLFNIFS